MKHLTIILIVIYLIGVSLTHGYAQHEYKCFVNVNGCAAVTWGAATFWPAYWVYHSGTLMFRPALEE